MEARCAVHALALLQEALVEERLEPIERIQCQVAVHITHALYRLQCAAADEHAQPSEQPLLGQIEQPSKRLVRWHHLLRLF